MNDISNTDDVIDSRDVIKRIEELESEREALTEDSPELAQWDDDYGPELKVLKRLAEQGEGYAPDWHHGETLVRDSYFTEYAEQLADDIGAVDRNARWPICHIDWEAAAEALKQDYASVDYDGITYWVRC